MAFLGYLCVVRIKLLLLSWAWVWVWVWVWGIVDYGIVVRTNEMILVTYLVRAGGDLLAT